MLNQELKVGDKVMLLYMEGEPTIDEGTLGVVTRVENFRDIKQYNVKWENGSNLSLLSDTDAWKKVGNVNESLKKNKFLKEDEIQRSEILLKNIDVFKFFNMKFFKQYLLYIRDSGITNMFGAGKYLYMGKDRIQHEFYYNEPPDEEAFEKVLENANTAQAEMINGVMRFLEKNNMETDLNKINYYLNKFASKIIIVYINLF